MSEEKNTGEDAVLTNTDLAFERTILGEKRTLMAWVRTAISLISFGFTIYKFFQEASTKTGLTHRLLSPRKVGMVMILFGLLSLVWGLMDHREMMNKLKKSYPGADESRSKWLAMLVLLFGIVMFLGVFFRQ